MYGSAHLRCSKVPKNTSSEAWLLRFWLPPGHSAPKVPDPAAINAFRGLRQCKDYVCSWHRLEGSNTRTKHTSAQ